MSYLESHVAPWKARSYDRDYATDAMLGYLWAQEQTILTAILDEFFGTRPVQLLDFACGTGRITQALEERVLSSTGVDVSESMLEVARTKLRRTTLLKINLLEEPVLPPGRFNLITAFRFFVNAEPELRRGALLALEPLLTNDGYFVFNNHQNTGAPYSHLARAYNRVRRRPPHNVLSLSQCRKLLAAVGLVIERVYPVGVLHIPYVNLPHALYRTADRLASTSDMLAALSESPIIVARRRS